MCGGRATVGVMYDGCYLTLEAVYRDNAGWVYRSMVAKVGNRADAEDLTAEVFLAALRPLRVPAHAGQVRTYLSVTARTVLARHWRRMLSRELEFETRIETTRFEPAQTADGCADTEAASRVAAILARLPEQYRRILQLRFLDSCSVREAADALGVSVTNAKVLQHRALRRAAALPGGGDPACNPASYLPARGGTGGPATAGS